MAGIRQQGGLPSFDCDIRCFHTETRELSCSSSGEMCSVQCVSILSQPQESSLALALVVHWTKVGEMCSDVYNILNWIETRVHLL